MFQSMMRNVHFPLSDIASISTITCSWISFSISLRESQRKQQRIDLHDSKYSSTLEGDVIKSYYSVGFSMPDDAAVLETDDVYRRVC